MIGALHFTKPNISITNSQLVSVGPPININETLNIVENSCDNILSSSSSRNSSIASNEEVEEDQQISLPDTIDEITVQDIAEETTTEIDEQHVITKPKRKYTKRKT